jgi:hypothetical protein
MSFQRVSVNHHRSAADEPESTALVINGTREGAGAQAGCRSGNGWLAQPVFQACGKSARQPGHQATQVYRFVRSERAEQLANRPAGSISDIRSWQNDT